MPKPTFNPSQSYQPATFDPNAAYTPAGDGQGSSPNYGPGVTVENPTPGQIGTGALREGAQLASGAYGFGRKALDLIPGVKNSRFGQAMDQHQATLDAAAKPQNFGEAMGKGGAQVLSYLAPAKLESGMVEAAPEFLRPFARIGTGALSSGTMGAANGQPFGASAVTGGVTSGLAEALRPVGVQLMRSGIGGGINSDTARAVLNETRAVRPSTLEGQVGARIAGHNADLDAAVDAANQRQAPRIAGFLMPPREEVPLHEQPFRAGKTSKPIILNQPDRPMPLQLEAPPNETPLATGGKFGSNGALEPQGVLQRPQEFPSETQGLRHGQYIGEIPGTTGGRKPLQGVLLRRPEMSASIPPTSEPAPIISINRMRSPLLSAGRTAANQEAGNLHNEIEDMLDFTRQGRVTGEPIGDNITPRRALDLRRGFNEQYLGNRAWKQTASSRATNAGKEAYGGLSSELHEKVPGATEADEAMHRLIPAKQALKALNRREPSVVGNVAGRMGARTGALTSTAMGAAAGAHERGLMGGIAGGTAGMLVPEIVNTPFAKIAGARMLYSPMAGKVARAGAVPFINWLRQQGTGGQSQ